MKEIIKNTPGTIAETKRWRDKNPEMPLMNAVHNAKASILMDELNDIRNNLDDPNEKINRIIDIIIRGIDFK